MRSFICCSTFLYVKTFERRLSSSLTLPPAGETWEDPRCIGHPPPPPPPKKPQLFSQKCKQRQKADKFLCFCLYNVQHWKGSLSAVVAKYFQNLWHNRTWLSKSFLLIRWVWSKSFLESNVEWRMRGTDLAFSSIFPLSSFMLLLFIVRLLIINHLFIFLWYFVCFWF